MAVSIDPVGELSFVKLELHPHADTASGFSVSMYELSMDFWEEYPNNTKQLKRSM